MVNSISGLSILRCAGSSSAPERTSQLFAEVSPKSSVYAICLELFCRLNSNFHRLKISTCIEIRYFRAVLFMHAGFIEPINLISLLKTNHMGLFSEVSKTLIALFVAKESLQHSQRTIPRPFINAAA